MKKIKKFLCAEINLIKMTVKFSPILNIINFVLIFILQLMPVILLKLYELLLNNISILDLKIERNIVSLLIIVTIYLLIDFIKLILIEVHTLVSNKIERKINYKLDIKIMNKLSKTEFQFFENPNNDEDFISAAESEYFLVRNNTWLVETLIRIITFVINIIILLSYDFLLVTIYIFLNVPGTILSYIQEKEMDKFSIDNIPENKEKNYYKNLLILPWFAKELRIYNLFDYFFSKYTNLWDNIRKKRDKLFNKGFLRGLISIILLSISYILIVVLLTNKIINKTIMVGTFILLLELVISNGETFSGLLLDIAVQHNIVIPRIERFFNFLNYLEFNDGDVKIKNQDFIVEFKDVFFKYPFSNEYTLENVSFKIGKNQKIAIVGQNGAGKSTIIKLLLKYYKPERGEILINGINLNSLSIKDLYKKISVCFQDVSKYSLSLRENICFSNIEKMSDNDKIKECIELSGINDIFNSEIENYLNKNLTRNFDDDGIELSGGEWQKVAIARCLFSDSMFIILDEPSSALDPIAEDKIFKAFNQCCKEKGGIIISHRLSSSLIADNIIVLDNGKIVESGTHKSLMKKKGLYFKMYSLQLEKYKLSD